MRKLPSDGSTSFEYNTRHEVLHYDIGEAVEHNEHQDSVPDVFITSLAVYPEQSNLASCSLVLISQHPRVTVRVVINGKICHHHRHIEMSVGNDR